MKKEYNLYFREEEDGEAVKKLEEHLKALSHLGEFVFVDDRVAPIVFAPYRMIIEEMGTMDPFEECGYDELCHFANNLRGDIGCERDIGEQKRAVIFFREGDGNYVQKTVFGEEIHCNVNNRASVLVALLTAELFLKSLGDDPLKGYGRREKTVNGTTVVTESLYGGAMPVYYVIMNLYEEIKDSVRRKGRPAGAVCEEILELNPVEIQWNDGSRIKWEFVPEKK